MSLRRKILKWTAFSVLGLVLFFVFAGFGAGFWVFARYGRTLPDYSQLADYEPPVVTHIYAGDGSLLTEFATEKRIFVPIEVIPPALIEAFLSAEDKNFYSHDGLDYRGIVRAAVSNVQNYYAGRRMEGASTITQQVAKNFLLTNEVSFERKLKEAILATRIERAFDKDEILELYMNEIYLGMGGYGVAAAALVYFNKSLDELTLSEMAYLAALPKAPNNYHPNRRREAAIARRNWVLARMEDNGFIDAETMRAAMAEPLMPQQMDASRVFRAEYFLEEVRREIYDMYGARGLYESGLSVHTTLNPRLQAIAETALRHGLIAYDRRHGWRGPIARIATEGDWAARLEEVNQPLAIDSWRLAVVLSVDAEEATLGFQGGAKGALDFEHAKWARPWIKGQRVGPQVERLTDVLSVGDVVAVEALAHEEGEAGPTGRYALRQIPDVEGALVALDPHTGRVLAMIGGFDFSESEFNRATQAQRQPGSAFKPFVYAAALDQGYTPSSIVLDAPVVIDQGGRQGLWKPRNYSNKFYGPSTLRLGLELSRNLMTVRLARAIGMDTVADYAALLDIDDDMQETLAMSLGAGETTPLKLTNAYAMLVNGGKYIEPSLIDRIQDRRGRVIYRHDQRSCDGCSDAVWDNQSPPDLPDTRPQVLDSRTAFQVVHMLQGVVERGTGRRIAALGRTIAGKTGTTNESKEGWFLGFSPDLAVGVFVGFDQPKSLGPREEGASVAVPIFKDFMAAALEGTPDIPFRIPSGIRLVQVDSKTGLPSRGGGTIYEAFKPGTEPTLDNQKRLVDGETDFVQIDRKTADELGGIY